MGGERLELSQLVIYSHSRLPWPSSRKSSGDSPPEGHDCLWRRPIGLFRTGCYPVSTIHRLHRFLGRRSERNRTPKTPGMSWFCPLDALRLKMRMGLADWHRFDFPTTTLPGVIMSDGTRSLCEHSSSRRPSVADRRFALRECPWGYEPRRPLLASPA